MEKREKLEFVQNIWQCLGEALELDSDDSEKDEIVLSLSRLGERATGKWVKEWRKHKDDRGSFAFLSRELFVNDADSYRNYLQLSKEHFDFLVSLVREDIQRTDTIMRNAIPVEEKLAITLRFLATGESYVSLDYQSRLSSSSICRIVPEICDALYKRLKSSYLKFPSSHAEWEEIAKEFSIKWQFPNCLGALDGKHINFRPPRKDGAFYYNYKGSNSIILLALVDSNCKFIFVNVGCNGRTNDAGVFLQSTLKNVLEDKNDLPQPSTVGNRRRLPYIVIGDDAFPLQTNLMKPYPYHCKNIEKQRFNERLSRARSVVEHAFGILSNRFRVFLAPMSLRVSTVQKITLACCALHNYLLENGEISGENVSNTQFVSNTSNTEDIPYNPRRGEAGNIRQQFMSYFNEEGKLEWLHPN